MNFPKIFSKTPTRSTSANATSHSAASSSISSSRSATSAKKDQTKKGRGGVPSKSHIKSSKAPSKSRTHVFTPYSDLDSHPLNLPPEERDRYRAIAVMSDPATPTDVDHDAPPSSSPAAPGAYPATNGVNGSKENDAPRPPPHRSPTASSSKAAEPAVDAEACKAAGNKFFKAKQYEKAVQEYTKAIEADPQSSTYRSNRAAALISANKYGDALEDAKAADELEPDNAKILHRLARVYTSLGRPSEALDVYSRIHPPASATDKATAKAMLQHITQAETVLKEGTTGSMAIHALDQAERGLGPGVDRPRKWKLMRGEALLKMGNVNALGDAQNVAMGLLRENNQDPEALVLRGRALYAQGDNDKAIQHFRQALACDPDFKDGREYLRMVQKLDRMKEEGNSFFKSGKYQEAVNVYTQALEVDPTNKGTNSKILQNRALCSIRLKDYNGAISDCDRAVALDPSYTKARRTRAKALGESGDWESAVRDLKKIAETSPEEPGIAKEIRNAELELKKSKRKDYYKILSVEKDAGDSEIKKAYRKLAIQTHPDKNPDDPMAEARFKDVAEAYETLSDPAKKQRYDSGEDLIDPSEMFGGGMGGSPFGGGGGMGGIDPEVLFSMFGGGMGGGGGGGPSFRFSTGGGGSPFGAQRGGGGYPF